MPVEALSMAHNGALEHASREYEASSRLHYIRALLNGVISLKFYPIQVTALEFTTDGDIMIFE